MNQSIQREALRTPSIGGVFEIGAEGARQADDKARRPDSQLALRTKDARIKDTDIEDESSWFRNFATFKIVSASARELLAYESSGNLPSAPGTVNDTCLGIHSEGWLSDRLQKLRRMHGELVVSEMFSERKPCAECIQLLKFQPACRGVFVAFAVSHAGNASGRKNAGEMAARLRRAYGL
ncbi:MAG: hypothetical protein AAFR38_00465 [Planctomycetota bacterium]